MNRALCIIPARGGSKRLPRKNIRDFRGRPMIAWSIAAAEASAVFDTIMVSTDDDEIATVAREAGADVPFMRSSETADDYATTADVLLEVLRSYAAIGENFDIACCLYPTAPLVEAHHLSGGRRLLEESAFDVVMPVVAFSYPIWRSLRRESDGLIALNFPENLNKRSQDLPPAYHDAGQWYWFHVPQFLHVKALMASNTGSVVLSPDRVQDIDTQEDWAMAELKHQRLFG